MNSVPFSNPVKVAALSYERWVLDRHRLAAGSAIEPERRERDKRFREPLIKREIVLSGWLIHYFLVFTINRVHCFSRGGSSFKQGAVNQRTSNLTSNGFRKAACFALKAAVQRSSEGNMLPGQSTIIEQGCLTANAMHQADAVAHGTIAADMAPAVDEFSIGNGELDLDCPTEGFSPISEAIEDIRQGKFVIIVDDESRENEGDLIMAAPLVTPEAMAFIVKYGTGIVCVSMKAEDLERLELPLMVSNKENEEKLCTAFTVSVDAKEGTTTGVSARDRAKTVKMLASADSNPEDFHRPGHIFPLKYREGGVLRRAGHTEASVDLAMLAELPPVGVLCEIVDEDGSMARLPKLRELAKKENLKIISIADLIRYAIFLSLARCHLYHLCRCTLLEHGNN
ncbi:hypothetical protein B296_00002385 [Ensete ventricosum]|uniref:3,4-dihydroxy-2-butanone-4-phosphate synthase n=1 Tax=Ensete ventricosum TaxID=4639 RepID=A0A427AXQ9_ENSVE|nr:hypothetical protein B296_00002385 [Ensete ventricosum]